MAIRHHFDNKAKGEASDPPKIGFFDEKQPIKKVESQLIFFGDWFWVFKFFQIFILALSFERSDPALERFLNNLRSIFFQSRFYSMVTKSPSDIITGIYFVRQI